MLGTKFSVSFKEKFPKVPRQRRQRPLGLEVENQIDRFFLFSCLHRLFGVALDRSCCDDKCDGVTATVTPTSNSSRPAWRCVKESPTKWAWAAEVLKVKHWLTERLTSSSTVCLNEKVTNRLFGGVLYLMPGSHSSTNINENANFKPVKSRPRAAEMRPGKATISCPVYQALFATYIVVLCWPSWWLERASGGSLKSVLILEY